MIDKDRTEGTADEAKGSIKENVGKMTGDRDTEAKGKAEKEGGMVQRKIGEMKDKLRDAFKK